MPDGFEDTTDQILDRAYWNEWMGQALRDLGSSLMLEENPLAHHPTIVRLAQRKYSRRFAPTGSALREVLLKSIEELIDETEEEPALSRECQYLRLWLQGKNVTQIARELQVTREHCSQTVRRRVLQMMVSKFEMRVSGAKLRGRVGE